MDESFVVLRDGLAFLFLSLFSYFDIIIETRAINSRIKAEKLFSDYNLKS